MAEVITTVGGIVTPLSDVAQVTDLQWSTGWPYGCLEASWSMLLPLLTFPPSLKANASVEIWDGPQRVWAGYLTESAPNDDGVWSFNAKGWYAAFANVLALNAGATAPTSTPATAVAQAITRAGLPITVGTTLSAVAFGAADVTKNAQTVISLLDAWVESTGQRWKVDENRILTVAADPTAYDYLLDSPEVLRGTADDDYVTHVYPRYVSNATGPVYSLGGVGAATTPAGRRERPMDLTDLGVLTGAAANAQAQGQLDLNSARLGYTSGAAVDFGDLTTAGGVPVRLGLVKAGQMFRALTVADASGAVQLGMTQDVVIGRTVYTDGATALQVDPVGLAPRTFTDTMQAALEDDTEFDGTAA